MSESDKREGVTAIRRYGKLSNTKDEAILYAADHSLRLHPAQEKLIDATQNVPHAAMLGSADELQLLANLAQAIGAKKTLDIGVFTGYSALSIALALPADGKVFAMDISDEDFKIGLPIIQEAGVDGKINFIKGPAVQSLQTLLDNGEAGTFDFAFIDANKNDYDAYYELSLKLLRKNGIIALDNMLWGGSVYNAERNEESTCTLREIAKKIHADQRVNVSFLTIGDGTVLAFKK